MGRRHLSNLGSNSSCPSGCSFGIVFRVEGLADNMSPKEGIEFLHFWVKGPFSTPRFLCSTLLHFVFWSLLIQKTNSRKKGTFVMKGILRNLDSLSSEGFGSLLGQHSDRV